MAFVRNRRVLAWVGIAAVVAVVGAAVFCFGVLPARRTALVWPAQGLVIVPGSAEEAAASFVASISRGEYDVIAARFTKRFGAVNPADIAKSVKANLVPMGKIERWLLVAGAPGNPVRVTAYCHFSRKGDQVLTIEIYREDGEWRFGNVGMVSPSVASWKPPAWLEGETDRLRIRVWPGHGADLGTLRNQGEAFFNQASAPLPTDLTDKVSVWVYDSLASLSAATGQLRPNWFAGTATLDGVIILSSQAMARNNQDFHSIFVHELNHYLLIRYVAAGGRLLTDLPSWLAEGLAGLAAGQLSGGPRSALLSSLPAPPAPLPSLAEVALGFGPREMPLRYEYAFSAVEYLVRTHGAGAPRRLIDFICAGATPEEAITKLTGLAVKDFEAAWHAWLRAGMPGR